MCNVQASCYDNIVAVGHAFWQNIVAAFRGMHVSPAKHSFAWLPRKFDYWTDRRTDGHTDRQTDRRTDIRRTKWSPCATMLRRRHKKRKVLGSKTFIIGQIFIFLNVLIITILSFWLFTWAGRKYSEICGLWNNLSIFVNKQWIAPLKVTFTFK